MVLKAHFLTAHGYHLDSITASILKMPVFLVFHVSVYNNAIREYGSTLYVGMTREKFLYIFHEMLFTMYIHVLVLL